MTQVACCPDIQELQQFALGRLGEADIERLEQHLGECSSCLTALERLSAGDSFMDAVRSRDATPVPLEASGLRELMAHLQDRPPAGPLEESATLAPAPAAPLEAATIAPDVAVTAEFGHYAFLAPPEQPDEIGRLGLFRILQLLGAGGMGMVFRAENLTLGRTVALKVMLPTIAATPAARERFIREAQAAAAIEHDHVIKIYHVEEDRGLPFLSMPLLRGESLDDRLKRDGRLPVAEVIRIGREIALGLAAAHERGLIHRDIKPANLWLEGVQGRIKILDFGLARAARDNAHLTQSGQIVGTPAYMAPEQSRGRGVDARADLFSLGCVLYRACTGQPPFQGADTLAVLTALAVDQPVPPRQVNPEVPAGLSRLVMRLLAKNPVGRPASANAVVTALTALAAGEQHELLDEAAVTEVLEILPDDPPSRARPRHTKPPDARPRRRRYWPIALASAATVLLAVLGPLALWCAPTVYRIVTNRGDLVIETDDGDVEVRVKQNGEQVTLIDTKSKKEVTLQAGTYELELVDGKDGLALTTNQFTLRRGRTEIVRVRLEPRPVVTTRDTNVVGEVRRIQAPAEVWSMALGPKDKFVLTGGEEDGSIRLWDVESGKERNRLTGHTGLVQTLAVSHDGRHALSGSHDGTMRLWEVTSGKQVRSFTGHRAYVTSVAFSPDDQYAVSTSGDGTVRVWNLATGKEHRCFAGHPAGIIGAWAGAHAAVFTADGNRVLSCGYDRMLRLWDVQTAKEVRAFPGHTSAVLSVALSPDGRHAVSSGDDAVVRLWDVATGKEVRRLEGHRGHVHCVRFSPDGSRILSGAEDRTLRLWDAASGRELTRFEAAPGWVLHVAFSSDGRRALSGGADRTVRVWHLPEPPSANLPAKLDAELPPGVKELSCFRDHGMEVRSGVFTRDGRHALTAGMDKTLRLWDVETGKEVRRFLGHTNWIWSVAHSPGGRQALTGSYDRTVRLWDIAIGKQVQCLTGHQHRVTCVAFCPDGKHAVSGSWDKTLRLWDLATGKEVRSFVGHQREVWCLAVSPDGRYLASGGWDATLRIWDLATGKQLARLYEHKALVMSLAFAPDGRRLVSLGGGHRLAVWDVPSWKKLQSSDGRGADSEGLALAADGCRVLSGNVCLWDLVTDKELARWRRQEKLLFLAFSPDGTRALSGSYDGTVRAWQLPAFPAQQAAVAANAALQPLLAREADPKSDPEKLRTDCLAFLRQHAGTAAAPRVGALLARLPSPLDRLDPAKMPFADRLPARPDLAAVLKGHTGQVWSVAFSPDGTQLASAGADGTLRLWELTAAEPRLARTFTAPGKKRIWNLAYSPDGTTVATASDAVRLWNLREPKAEPVVIAGFPNGVSRLAFAPDGRTLATGTWDPVGGCVQLWDLTAAPPRVRTALRGPTGVISGLAYAPDGKQVALTGLDAQPTVWLWDLTGKSPTKIAQWRHSQWVYPLAFAPAGQTLAAGCNDGKVRLWDLRNPTLPAQAVLPWGNTKNEGTLAFAPDGQTLASGGGDGQVMVWDLATHAKLWEWQPPGDWRRPTVQASVAFAPDSRYLAAGSVEGTIYILRLHPPPAPARS